MKLVKLGVTLVRILLGALTILLGLIPHALMRGCKYLCYASMSKDLERKGWTIYRPTYFVLYFLTNIFRHIFEPFSNLFKFLVPPKLGKNY